MEKQHMISVYGAPGMPSMSLSPVVGQSDPHIAHANGEVAMVASVASDVLSHVIEHCLDVISDPDASPSEKESARKRVKTLVGVVQDATAATDNFAAAESAGVQLLGTPSAGWKGPESDGSGSPADRLANEMASYFDKSREHLTSAVEGLENDPALPLVLERRRQPNGLHGFFQRVAAVSVSLTALGQRAISLPGLVRQSFSKGLDRADFAVQEALDRWHAQLGSKIDTIRTSASEKAAEVSSKFMGGLEKTANVLDEYVDRAMRATTTGVEKVKTVGQSVGETAKSTAQITTDGFMALDKVVTQHVRSFWKETVVPALQRFSAEFKEEFNNQRMQRASRVNTNFTSMEQAGAVPVPENLGIPPSSVPGMK